MKFGILKSKIEQKLSESYSNGNFKEDIGSFKKFVLNDKNVSKMFYLYDELNSNKGLNESIADDYINECVVIYENLVNKIEPKKIKLIENWVKDVKTENLYETIDGLFHTDILKIETKIRSRKSLKESLIRKPKPVKENVNLPISTMLNVANKTISNYIENLTESEKTELVNYLKEDDSKLEPEFNSLKETVKLKLTTMKDSENDSETKNRITETIQKVSTEKYDKLSYFKLKNLNENL